MGIVATCGLGIVQHYGLGDVSITKAFSAQAMARIQPASGATGTSGSLHAASPSFEKDVPGAQMMAGDLGRREFLKTAGAAAALSSPLAALADGATSKATRLRARTIYGSRIFGLKDAAAEAISADEQAFQLFITGAYRSLDKKIIKELNGLKKDAISAAKKGDKAAANAAVQKFCTVAALNKDPMNSKSIFQPKQRRNPGAGTTADVEAQMGPLKYAYYQMDDPAGTEVVNRESGKSPVKLD